MKISLLFIQIKKVKNSNTYLSFGGRSSRIVKIQPFILIWNWRWVKSFHTFHSIQTVQEMEGFYTFLMFQFKFSSITKFRMAFFQWKLWFKFTFFSIKSDFLNGSVHIILFLSQYVRFPEHKKSVSYFDIFSLCSNIIEWHLVGSECNFSFKMFCFEVAF